MADVGSIKLKVRLRVEAGIGASLTDVGHADLEVSLPVEITALSDTETAGAAVTVDTTVLTSRLTDAVAAFEHSLTET